MKNWIASYSSTGLIIAGAVIGVPLACWLDIYYGFVRFESANSGLHLGDAMVVAACMNVTLMAILFLRGRRLKLAIQRRVDAETRANRLARNDSLTGLANRRTFQAELQRRIESSHADEDTVAILLVDLDRFKPVNDAHGHTAGDLLLQRVADRLTACTRNDEFVARLSADEFAVIVSVPKAEPTEPTILAQRIVTALSRRFAIGEDDLQIGACVGIAVHTEGLTAEDLVKNADQAMYRAKQTGRNRVAHFSAALGKETCERALLESQIHRALRQGEFEPFFQPLIDLPSGETCGFEILARWRHPERGLVSPAVFIPVAEEIGLIGDITLHILHKACETALTWQEPYSLSFNLSPLQFQQPGLMDKITEILVETGFPGERLEMEITESAIILDITAARTAIEQFKAFGFSVALDDFGTGHSSLTTLRQLPFDKVKIDRSFVTGSVEDEENRKIVLGIIGLAHSLGLEVTAEGIETEAESAWLREIGCEMAQGFLFSCPLPADQLQWYIDEEAERSAARPDAATRQAAHG